MPAMSAAASSSHRIVSYNVRYFGHALHGLASTHRSQKKIAEGFAGLAPRPQLICLQEVETRSLRSTLAHRGKRNGGTQLEAFMAQLEQAFSRNKLPCPYAAFYFGAHTYRLTHRLNVYTTGLAILVDLEAFKVEAHNVAAPEKITYYQILRVKDRKQTRICAHMRLLGASGRPLHLFNTHLSLPSFLSRNFWTGRHRMGFSANQLEEAKNLAAFVRRTAGGEPFVVCGDFNAPPGSPVYRHLTEEAGFNGAQEGQGQCDIARPHDFPTAGFMRLRMHLDHLFSGGGAAWTDVDGTCRFGDRASPFHGLSDHVPLLAGFRLPD
jgi:endonuclease/exonuclease/phosphatase family metal-dependent hydrolase